MREGYYSCLMCLCVCLCVCLSVTALAASACIHSGHKRYTWVSCRLFLDFLVNEHWHSLKNIPKENTNKAVMTSKRGKSLSVASAVSLFHSEVKFGPDFVCTFCHRMMYRKSVIQCNTAFYTKASAKVLITKGIQC